jgi:hypothetical protein
MQSSLVFHNILTGHLGKKLEKPQDTNGLLRRKLILCYVVMISVGCFRRATYTSLRRAKMARPNFATAARTPRMYCTVVQYRCDEKLSWSTKELKPLVFIRAIQNPPGYLCRRYVFFVPEKMLFRVLYLICHYSSTVQYYMYCRYSTEGDVQ